MRHGPLHVEDAEPGDVDVLSAETGTALNMPEFISRVRNSPELHIRHYARSSITCPMARFTRQQPYALCSVAV